MFHSKSCCATIFLILLLFFNNSFAEQRYFLCGSDEDGCLMENVQYCACIAYDELHANKPYCLDFNKMRCEPLVNVAHCDPDNIYENQSQCLATIYQSEPEPGCPMTTQSFCIKNHTPICNSDGDVNSCHAT